MSEQASSGTARGGFGNKKVRVGEVISDKMMKTIIVRVTRKVTHPLYHRTITRHNSFKAHDEKGEAKVGDLVKVVETRPLSKDKRWRLVEIVRRASDVQRIEEVGT